MYDVQFLEFNNDTASLKIILQIINNPINRNQIQKFSHDFPIVISPLVYSIKVFCAITRRHNRSISTSIEKKNLSSNFNGKRKKEIGNREERERERERANDSLKIDNHRSNGPVVTPSSAIGNTCYEKLLLITTA